MVSTIFIIVPGKNGMSAIAVAAGSSRFSVILIQITPLVYSNMFPIMIAIRFFSGVYFLRVVSFPTAITSSRYPIKKPPVGPSMKANPLPPFENTGSPIIPKKRYNTTASAPYLSPKKSPASMTKKSARTIGTGLNGKRMLMCDPIIIRAINSAV